MNPHAAHFRYASFVIKRTVDIIATLFLWIYFTLGHLFFFLPAYLLAAFLAKDRERAFQHLNHLFFRGFFALAQILIPGFTLKIDPAVTRLHGSVIVCNHVSYFDPILLIALFKRQKTIVKSDFFSFPFLGWNLKLSGYLPATATGSYTELVYKGISSMAEYLSSGGNLFVFPEGTRRRDGKMGRFNKGAFSIARKCRAPVQVIEILNTDRLFSPGHALLNTCIANRVTVMHKGEIDLSRAQKKISTRELIRQTRRIFKKMPSTPETIPDNDAR
ncbi:MAG: 1-acyl-sn-glycerol-3-phosphate acyltransferase [Deltaproteobacteria bacterium]|nr:MAG: 1-acyl-sn-glycerol-3-phosphate acyltransferase [Deltaproteobacteria bacterium]